MWPVLPPPIFPRPCHQELLDVGEAAPHAVASHGIYGSMPAWVCVSLGHPGLCVAVATLCPVGGSAPCNSPVL